MRSMNRIVWINETVSEEWVNRRVKDNYRKTVGIRVRALNGSKLEAKLELMDSKNENLSRGAINNQQHRGRNFWNSTQELLGSRSSGR